MMVNQIKNIHVNPDYSHLTDFLYSIPGNFDLWGSVVHSDRNEIREGYVNGIHLAIKSFKRITWVNRVIFATIRKTKARRSYEYSIVFFKKEFLPHVLLLTLTVIKIFIWIKAIMSACLRIGNL